MEFKPPTAPLGAAPAKAAPTGGLNPLAPPSLGGKLSPPKSGGLLSSEKASQPASSTKEPRKGINTGKLKSLRANKKPLIRLAKTLAIFIWIASLTAFGFLKFDLDENNQYLSNIGLVENTGKKFKRLDSEKIDLSSQIRTTTNQYNSLKRKIDNEQFSAYERELTQIRDGQVNWYDEINDDGTVKVFGIMDAFPRAAEYFNSRQYQDEEKIINGPKNNVVIQDFSVSRDGGQVSVQVSEVLGRVFYLANEFLEIVNSFDFFKNGEVREFSRTKNEIGDDTMSFSLSLETQTSPNPGSMEMLEKKFFGLEDDTEDGGSPEENINIPDSSQGFNPDDPMAGMPQTVGGAKPTGEDDPYDIHFKSYLEWLKADKTETNPQ